MTPDMNDFRDLLDVKFEAMRAQHADLAKKMDSILVRFDENQRRIGDIEGDMKVLQERTSPWAASTIIGALVAVVGAMVEYLRR